jgi:hypothetical protein
MWEDYGVYVCYPCRRANGDYQLISKTAALTEHSLRESDLAGAQWLPVRARAQRGALCVLRAFTTAGSLGARAQGSGLLSATSATCGLGA